MKASSLSAGGANHIQLFNSIQFVALALILSSSAAKHDGASTGWATVKPPTDSSSSSSSSPSPPPSSGTWQQLANLFPNVVEFGAAALSKNSNSSNGDMIVFGGYSYADAASSNATMRYDASADAWTALESMPGPARQGVYGIFVEPLGSGEGVVLALGGSTGSDPATGQLLVTSRVDALDVATGTWKPHGYLPDLPVALMVSECGRE